MQEFKIKLTRKEYLEIKRKALLDRIKYADEIDVKKEDVEKTYKAKECIVETCADEHDYVGDVRSAYCSNFLIPDDFKFAEYHEEHHSRTACKEYFDVSFEVIQSKILFMGMFGKYKDLAEVEAALASLDKEEGLTTTETLELQDEQLVDEEKKASQIEVASKMFTPLEHLDIEEDETEIGTSIGETTPKFSTKSLSEEISEKVSSQESDFEFDENDALSQRKPILARNVLLPKNNSSVERQTEEALEKINSLFEKNDTKEQKISNLEKENEEKTKKIKVLEKEAAIKDGTVSSLEAEIERLRQIVISLEEKMEEITAKNVGLQQENATLIEQYQRIIRAINEKYGEYIEGPAGKTR